MADPDFTPRCLKCGSDAMVPDVRVGDRSDGGVDPSVVALQRKPGAWVFKGRVRIETRAVVCGDCGFVELYADDPHAIWEAHIDRKANELGPR